MPLNWMDVSNVSFNAVILLEEVQLSWLPGWLPENELRAALRANPAVEWFMRHKCPALNPWLNHVMAGDQTLQPCSPEEVRAAEVKLLRSMEDLLVYALDPAVYDAQPFLGWDSTELTSLADFNGKTVIDVGSGTGRLAFTVAEQAGVVFAVEPVANLRRYLREKARTRKLANLYPVDGLITGIPFPARFADVALGGHVYGDDPAGEYAELERVTKPGGVIILCPGNNDVDNDAHRFLVDHGFEWSVFIEPPADRRRKYWKRISEN